LAPPLFAMPCLRIKLRELVLSPDKVRAKEALPGKWAKELAREFCL
jgi:hypothetical protein